MSACTLLKTANSIRAARHLDAARGLFGSNGLTAVSS
jgi:hypothetical protein